MAAAISAYKRGFKMKPVFIRSGGTIPVVRLLQDLFGIPTVMMGFALPTSRIHAPNENLHLPTFFRGISTCIWFLHEIACMQVGTPESIGLGRVVANTGIARLVA